MTGRVLDGGIVEGATRLFPPPGNLGLAPGRPGARAKGQPFYNPAMALNRDLSVLLVAAEARRKGREIDVADALAGTGARAVRLAHEVPYPVVVHANDGQPEAIAALRRAAVANAVPAARLAVHEGDAHVFLAQRRFDVVDLDPCGSPMPFLDAAVRATRDDGLLCATATDTGALSGTFPRACQRRYDAHHGLHHAAWRAEVGLRILGGALVRAAARFDRAATPVLSVCHGHWMRVVARIHSGRKDADAAVKGLRHAKVADDGLPALVPRHGGWPADGRHAGPLWAGPLHEGVLVAAMLQEAEGRTLAQGPALLRLAAVLQAESAAPPFWFVSHAWEAELGPPPQRDALMASLQAAGFVATRSHMDPQGIRTDAPAAAIRGLWRGTG